MTNTLRVETLTDRQKDTLVAMIDATGANVDAHRARVKTKELATLVATACGLTPRSIGGIMSSLLKKGLVKTAGASYMLTAKGVRHYRDAKTLGYKPPTERNREACASLLRYSIDHKSDGRIVLRFDDRDDLVGNRIAVAHFVEMTGLEPIRGDTNQLIAAHAPFVGFKSCGRLEATIYP